MPSEDTVTLLYLKCSSQANKCFILVKTPNDDDGSTTNHNIVECVNDMQDCILSRMIVMGGRQVWWHSTSSHDNTVIL